MVLSQPPAEEGHVRTDYGGETQEVQRVSNSKISWLAKAAERKMNLIDNHPHREKLAEHFALSESWAKPDCSQTRILKYNQDTAHAWPPPGAPVLHWDNYTTLSHRCLAFNHHFTESISDRT